MHDTDKQAFVPESIKTRVFHCLMCLQQFCLVELHMQFLVIFFFKFTDLRLYFQIRHLSGLRGYPVCRVKTGVSGPGSCDLDPS
jgi:hypothetical protein